MKAKFISRSAVWHSVSLTLKKKSK